MEEKIYQLIKERGNQRMSMMVRMLEKMDPARKKKLFGLAKKFIARVVA